ncbi:MAG: hypothetical protein Q9227_008364 [Pyrenula ochraceoflavens]
MSQRVLIYLLRRDLRLADNPILHDIGRTFSQSQHPYTHLLPVFVFPAQQVEVSGFLRSPEDRSPYPEARSQVGNFWRCGPHRAKFLAESVWDLKTALESVGSGLTLRVGMQGQVVKELLETFKEQSDVETVGVWMTSEEGVEEKREEGEVQKAVEAAGKEFKLWVDEKYYIDDRDLPFPKPSGLPDVFTSFRKTVEPLRSAPRRVLSKPSKLPPIPTNIPPHPAPFSMPETLDNLKTSLLKPLDTSPVLANPPSYPSPTESAHSFSGGATSAHDRLHHLLTDGAAASYKDTRNGLLGLDFSTKLSAYLALGCITARQVHASLLAFEDAENSHPSAEKWKSNKHKNGYGAGENKGTAGIRFELLWRDYMRLCTRKFGPRLFRISGFRDDESYPWKSPSSSEDHKRILDRFLRGDTGTGLIDASQRELLHTGYTSNRARQNVASFWAKHLGFDWRVGAEWYECNLVDYDVSSNWGNWQYVAGVGNDPRGESRVFNPVKQSHDYDREGEYIKAWVPELRDVSDVQGVWQGWMISEGERANLGIKGLEWVERPLKRINFSVDRKGGGGGGRGGKNNERGRGRGGGGYRGARGGGGGGRWRGQGHNGHNGHGGGKQGRTGPMDKEMKAAPEGQ